MPLSDDENRKMFVSTIRTEQKVDGVVERQREVIERLTKGDARMERHEEWQRAHEKDDAVMRADVSTLVETKDARAKLKSKIMWAMFTALCIPAAAAIWDWTVKLFEKK